MKKLSRKARKEAKARQTHLGQIRQSIAIVAVTIAAAAAPVVEAAPAPEPVDGMAQVEELAPPTDPIPWSVPISSQTIPPPPESGVRLVRALPANQVLTDENEEKDLKVKEIDRGRLFDQVLRSLYGFCLFREDLMQMTYYISLREFLKRCTWRQAALRRARRVNGVTLWYNVEDRGEEFPPIWQPTVIGEEVWQRFRLRIRRESALARITDGLYYNPRRNQRAA